MNTFIMKSNKLYWQSPDGGVVEVENPEAIMSAADPVLQDAPFPLQCRVEKILILHCKQMNGSGCTEGCKVIPMTHGKMDCKFEGNKSKTVARVTFDEQPEEDNETKSANWRHNLRGQPEAAAFEQTEKKEHYAGIGEDGDPIIVVVDSQPETVGQEQETQHKCIYCNGTGYSNKPPLGQ